MAQQQAQSDPWAEAAKAYKPSQEQAQPQQGGDDWKIWQQGDEADTRSGMQKNFDTATQANPQDPAGIAFMKSALRSGMGPVMHPIQTLKNLVPSMPTEQSVLDSASARSFGPIQQQGRLSERLGSAFGSAALASGVGAVAGGLTDMIPSKARAGAKLNEIQEQAKDVPVSLKRTGEPLLRGQTISERGGPPLPRAAGALAERVTNPDLGDMLYPEARDYYSNLSQQSVMDRFTMNGQMRRQLGLIREGLKGDIHDAAASIGRGADYDAAMNEYARAAKMGKIGKAVGIGAASYGASKAAGPLVGRIGRTLMDLK